jgi:hypothetical protein
MKMCKVNLKEQSIYVRLQKRKKTKSSPMSFKIDGIKNIFRGAYNLFFNDLKLPFVKCHSLNFYFKLSAFYHTKKFCEHRFSTQILLV